MEYKKILTFSFDDGVTQDIRFIEILNKYRLKGTFNLNSGLLGKSGSLEIAGKTVSHNKVSKADVPDIYKGHEIAAHTLTHPFLTQLSKEEITRQVEGDRLALSEIAGEEILGFAYPGGGVNFNNYVAETIKNTTRIKYARTIVSTHSFEQQNEPYTFKPTISLTKEKEVLLKLSDDFISQKPEKPKLFYIWGHSYELDVNGGWEFFEDFCRKISGKDDILYCTNKEAFEISGLI